MHFGFYPREVLSNRGLFERFRIRRNAGYPFFVAQVNNLVCLVDQFFLLVRSALLACFDKYLFRSYSPTDSNTWHRLHAIRKDVGKSTSYSL